jgi:hypothetical protein
MATSIPVAEPDSPIKSYFGSGIPVAKNKVLELKKLANKLDDLALLQAAIRQTHQCEAVHSQTVSVHEMVGGRTIWKGEVEVFDLNGLAEAKRCFAWLHDEKGKAAQHVMVLERHPVNSPEMAVKYAIFFDVQPVSFPCLDSPS